MDTYKLGERMRRRRNELGLSSRELGARVGLNSSTILRYELNNIKEIKLAVIEKIAHVLGVNPGWLLGVDDEKFLSNESIYSARTDTVDVMDQLNDLIALLLGDSALSFNNKHMSSDERLALVKMLESSVDIFLLKRKK